MEPLKPEHQALFDDLRVIAGKHLLQVRIAFGRAVAHHLYAGSVRVMEDRLVHRGSGLKDFVAACGNLDTELPNVSGTLSSVHLRNPHGTNEPDLHGEGTAPGQDEGEFDMPLDGFLRAFTRVRGCIAESP